MCARVCVWISVTFITLTLLTGRLTSNRRNLNLLTFKFSRQQTSEEDGKARVCADRLLMDELRQQRQRTKNKHHACRPRALTPRVCVCVAQHNQSSRGQSERGRRHSIINNNFCAVHLLRNLAPTSMPSAPATVGRARATGNAPTTSDGAGGVQFP